LEYLYLSSDLLLTTGSCLVIRLVYFVCEIFSWHEMKRFFFIN
jgi:hypothetical protein